MVLGPGDHAVIGGMSGTIEVLCMQPTVAMKNAIQEGRPIPSNPLHWYRGVTVRSAVSPVCGGAPRCLLAVATWPRSTQPNHLGVPLSH